MTEQRARKPYRRWTQRQREAFLDHLAVTGNVAASCRAVEIDKGGAYMLRRTDPGFAAAWRAALLAGYDRLEEMLLARAGAATADAEAALDSGTLDPEQAIRLLAMHHARERNGPTRPTRALQRARPEETDAAILRQLAALDRQIKRQQSTAPKRGGDDAA